MNNQKGFVNIILVVVIVAIIAVGGYFIFIKKSRPIIQQPTSTTTQTTSPIIVDVQEIKINYRLMDFKYSSGSPDYKEGQTVEFITQYPSYINDSGYESILETNIEGDVVHINFFNLGTYDKFLDVPNPTIISVRGKVSSHPTEKGLVYMDVVHWEKADPQLRLKVERAKNNIREFLNLNGGSIAKSMTKKFNIPNDFPISKFLSKEIDLLALDTKNSKAVFNLRDSKSTGKGHDGGFDTQEATMQVVYSFSDEKIQQIYADYKLGFFYIGE